MLSRGAFVRALLVSAVAVGGPSCSRSHSDRTRTEEILARLRDRYQAPGIAAAVFINGRSVFRGGIGVANLETGMAQDGNTVFSIASISKTMTAVAIMQLVEAGKVRLDDEIQRFAPWFPRKQRPITVFELLTHTSGIRHYRDNEDSDSGQWMDAFRHYQTLEQATRFWRNDPLLFSPGTFWSYSTYAFTLLQAVVESASGMPFELYLLRYIWAPASMTSTRLDVAGRIVPRREQGYFWDDARVHLERSRDEDDSYKYAGGGILSSDEDLCRFATALNAGILLKPVTVRQMYRPQLARSVHSFSEHDFVPSTGQALTWDCGVDDQGRPYVEHGGDNKGTISHLINFWQQDAVVAVHTNVYPSPQLGQAARNIADLYL